MESKTSSSKNKLYPVFLKLEQLDLLLVGAGNVGLEKLNSLLSNSPEARITVVAPLVKNEVRELLAQHPSSSLQQRAFTAADLNEKDIVVLATDQPELHKQIKAQCEEKGILVNVADTPDLCDFYLGSIVQKGDLKIAVSTNGKSPTVAKRIREMLEEVLPEEIDELLQQLQLIRSRIKGDFSQKVAQLNELTRTLTIKD